MKYLVGDNKSKLGYDLNILVLEDNAYEKANIVRILQSIPRDFIIYEASRGEEGLRILNNVSIDIFILDIELPDTSGLKIAEEIRKIPQYELTYIIFVTTHVYLQLDAFKKVHCYDFLEKPYKKEELTEIIDRLAKGVLKQKQTSHTDRQQISFQMKDCIIKMYADEILFIESQRRNCIIHTKDRRYTIKNRTIKKVLEVLSNQYFIQTHKSYIINLKNIYQIERHEKNSWVVYFKEYPLTAYVSNSYKEKLKDRFSYGE